jgi:hypothetical protein
VQHHLALCHVYGTFCLSHVRVRQPLAQSVPTHGSGSAQVWRPWTPAMAAGLMDHGWLLRAVVLYRMPPWPQPQRV